MIDSKLLEELTKKYQRVVFEKHHLKVSTIFHNYRIDYRLLDKCFDENYNVKEDIVRPETCCSICYVDESIWSRNFIGLKFSENGAFLCKQCANALYYEFDY